MLTLAGRLPEHTISLRGPAVGSLGHTLGGRAPSLRAKHALLDVCSPSYSSAWLSSNSSCFSTVLSPSKPSWAQSCYWQRQFPTEVTTRKLFYASRQMQSVLNPSESFTTLTFHFNLTAMNTDGAYLFKKSQRRRLWSAEVFRMLHIILVSAQTPFLQLLGQISWLSWAFADSFVNWGSDTEGFIKVSEIQVYADGWGKWERFLTKGQRQAHYIAFHKKEVGFSENKVHK